MNKNPKEGRPAPLFWALAAFFLIVFLTGGASRVDVESLPLLRPIALILCGIGFWTLRREHLDGRKGLLILLGGIFGLAALYVVPLPSVVWQNMPGREQVSSIDQMVGLGNMWRSVAIAPSEGVNALFSLVVPMAVIIVGIQLRRKDVRRLLLVIIAIGALSGIISVMQIISNSDSALYFYKITNNGSAVGFFANRNHAAAFLACLFPILAVYASSAGGAAEYQNRRQYVAIALAIILVPLLLVIGSRSGLLLSLLGLAGATLIYRNSDRQQNAKKDGRKTVVRSLLAGAAVLSLAFVTYFLSRAEAIERLFYEAQDTDLRQDFWVTSVMYLKEFFPWGAGPGAFANAYQAGEPLASLDSTYLNHAHNDWIETIVTMGGFGVLIFAVAIFFYVRRTWTIWRRADSSSQSTIFARMASITVLLIALSSVTDYPLRTPTMMALFALFLIWFTEPVKRRV